MARPGAPLPPRRKDAGQEIAAALGLDLRAITSVQIELAPGQAPKLTVSRVINSKELAAVKGAIEAYQLERRQGSAPA